MPVSTHPAGASLALTAVCLPAAGCGTGDAPDSRSDAQPTASPARRTARGPADRLTLSARARTAKASRPTGEPRQRRRASNALA
ncbi:hypothetical protein [Streptomyces qinglanensis]|uniref:hypothetical protein n=1 Tax=Streptomyces qinglanensis TaxID=943816 RepID=UPI0037B796AF